jgi:hypothetical protein
MRINATIAMGAGLLLPLVVAPAHALVPLAAIGPSDAQASAGPNGQDFSSTSFGTISAAASATAAQDAFGPCSANSSATVSGAGGVSTHATSSNFACAGGTSIARLIFYFDVSGPPGTTVPTFIDTAGEVSGDVLGSSYVSFLVNGVIPLTLVQGNGSFSTHGPYSVPSDTTIAVELSALTQAAVTNASTASADISAFINPPQIFIDPNFPLASEFTPVFSPNLVVGAVPEPSTWAMMLAGFAGLGLIGRRSRRGDASV